MGFTQTEKDKIVEFVHRNSLGVVSTISKEYTPAGATVYLSVTKDLNFYFMTRAETDKAQNIIESPNVALTVYDARTLEALQVQGLAKIVTEPNEIHEAMGSLQKTIGEEKKFWRKAVEEILPSVSHEDTSKWIPPLAQLNKGGHVVIKVQPHWVRFRTYESDKTNAEEFGQIEGTF